MNPKEYQPVRDHADWPLVQSKATYRSGAVVDACIPVEWDHKWHRIVKPSKELTDRVLKKYGKLLGKGGQGEPNA